MCWFLTYINMNQPQVYVCPLPPEQCPHLPPHSLQGCHRAVGGAPCVKQQIPTCYLFYMG